MNSHRVQFAVAVFVLFSAALAMQLDSRPVGQDPEFVRVAVRFAVVRHRPDPAAAAVKEIGYGTILNVLATSGEFFRVAPLGVENTVQPWYVLRRDVESTALAKAQDTVQTRSVSFAPSDPVPGRQLLFTARGFGAPNLLKWDMGDGTVLITGGRASLGGEATLAYAYAVAGTYLVKVFDKGGADGLLPVTLEVKVFPRTQETPLNASQPPQRAETPQDPPRETGVKPSPAETPKDLPGESGEKAPPVAPTAVSLPAAPIPAPARSKYPFIKLGPYGGFFRPTDALFKEIYGEGDVLFGGRLGLRIWKGFYLWLSLAQYKSIGRTSFSEDKTTLTLTPASAFLRFDVGQGFFIPYVGVGYTFLSYEEDAADIGGINKDSGGDAALEAGFEFKVSRHLYIDLGARFTRILFPTENPLNPEELLDLGGLQAGISLLISF
jgi:hypothetical protein